MRPSLSRAAEFRQRARIEEMERARLDDEASMREREKADAALRERQQKRNWRQWEGAAQPPSPSAQLAVTGGSAPASSSGASPPPPHREAREEIPQLQKLQQPEQVQQPQQGQQPQRAQPQLQPHAQVRGSAQIPPRPPGDRGAGRGHVHHAGVGAGAGGVCRERAKRGAPNTGADNGHAGRAAEVEDVSSGDAGASPGDLARYPTTTAGDAGTVHCTVGFFGMGADDFLDDDGDSVAGARRSVEEADDEEAEVPQQPPVGRGQSQSQNKSGGRGGNYSRGTAAGATGATAGA